MIVLSDEDRQRHESLARKQPKERRIVVRARIVLAAADGMHNASIAERLEVSLHTVIQWRKRFFEKGFDGLTDRERSGRPGRSMPPALVIPVHAAGSRHATTSVVGAVVAG
ncbi:MAG: helix-turn-helix domain-containing protein [Acidimicrobiales bacterium]